VLAVGQRLRRRNEFSSAIRAGRRAGRGGLVVHLVTPTATADTPARAGFIVSKAVGNAVVRNRVRRRLRHLVRDRLDQLPSGSELVVRVLPAATGRSYQQLGADLDAAVAEARTTRSGAGERRERRAKGAVT
jgi:ribonuclease P protein component